MKKIVLLMIFSFNAFACMDLDLKDRSLKVDIEWKYAPFGGVSVLEDSVVYNSKKSPSSINLSWENHPYELNALIDISKPKIAGEGKVILAKFFGKNTETGSVKEKVKLSQIEEGKAKVKFYDISTSKYVTFLFKEISLEEWVDMDCPNKEPESENKILIL